MRNRNRVTNVENKPGYQGENGRGKGEWVENEKTELDKYMLLYRNRITNKDLLCSPGSSTQDSVMTYMGKEYTMEWKYAYV